MQNSETLKPCPFCGGAVTQAVEVKPPSKTDGKIMHTTNLIHDCRERFSAGYDGGLELFFADTPKPQLIDELAYFQRKRWNTRAEEASQPTPQNDDALGVGEVGAGIASWNMDMALNCHIAAGWTSTGSSFADMKHGFIAGWQASTSGQASTAVVESVKQAIGKVFIPSGVWNIEEGMKLERAAKAALAAIREAKP